MNSDQVMNICRGCLAADRKVASATLYKSEFKDLTGITISPSDKLPQWLCYECVALLQKSVRFGNKVMRSHYTLCKYVLENLPFACNKDDYTNLSRSTMWHYDVPGTQTELSEVATDYSTASDVHMPVITKIEGTQDQDEIAQTAQKLRDKTHHNILDMARKSPSRSVAALKTNNTCFITLNHVERTGQGEVEEQLSSVVADTDLESGEVKDESSSADHDDITIEESCKDQPNALKSETSKRKPNRKVQTVQKQTARELVRAGTRAARHSVRARGHLHENTDISSTIHKEGYKENVKGDFNSDDSVNGNLRNNVQLYICDECKKCFNNKSLLIAHIRGHSKINQELYRCNVCMKHFSRKSTYYSHIRIHNEEKPYKCDVCMKSFRRKADCKRHILIHTGLKPYKCDVCTKAYTQKQHLNIHMLIHHHQCNRDNR